MPIVIKSVSIRNFRSYGDYETTINLDGLGPILIVGEIEGTGSENGKLNSNGAGKSTIPDAIVWCLFGRLPYKDKPADNIVNWDSKKNCMVKIITTDNYQIIRTRKMEGMNDLIIIDPDGSDISVALTSDCQKIVERIFNLDYEIFVSSMFFTQFDKPLLEKSDIKRRRTLERMLGLRKFDYYADVTKSRIASLESTILEHKVVEGRLNSSLMQIDSKIEDNKNKITQFEADRKRRIDEKKDEISRLKNNYENDRNLLILELVNQQDILKSMPLFDISSIKAEWVAYQKKLDKIKADFDRLSKLKNDKIKLSTEISILSNDLDKNDDSVIRKRADDIKVMKSRLNNMKYYDLDDIRVRCDKRDGIKQLLLAKDVVINKLNNSISSLLLDIKRLREEKRVLDSKVDKVCPECGQLVPEGFISTKVSPIADEIVLSVSKHAELIKSLAVVKSEVDGLRGELVGFSDVPELAVAVATNARVDEVRSNISTAESVLSSDMEGIKRDRDVKRSRVVELRKMVLNLSKVIDDMFVEVSGREKLVVRPEFSVQEVMAFNQKRDRQEVIVVRAKESLDLFDSNFRDKINVIDGYIEEVRGGVNPYVDVEGTLRSEQDVVRGELTGVVGSIRLVDNINKHYLYLRKVFSDRKCIKAFLIRSLIPFLNERISYYLKIMGCDFELVFNEFLQSSTSVYPYEYWSGGERRRIDLSVMLALHDLNNTIYSKQSNVLVFDEVERSLESSAIESFIELIFSEFRDKTVLVISHSEQLLDAFPKKLVVRRKSRYNSVIGEIR